MTYLPGVDMTDKDEPVVEETLEPEVIETEETDGVIVDVFKLLLNFYNRKDVTLKEF